MSQVGVGVFLFGERKNKLSRGRLLSRVPEGGGEVERLREQIGLSFFPVGEEKRSPSLSTEGGERSRDKESGNEVGAGLRLLSETGTVTDRWHRQAKNQ